MQGLLREILTLKKRMEKTTTKQARFNQLHQALQYCTENRGVKKEGIFTAGERIAINQERGKLLDFQDESDFINEPAPAFDYDTALNDKIEFIIEKLRQTAWTPRPRLYSVYGV